MKALNIFKLVILFQLIFSTGLMATENVVYRELSDREKQAMVDEYKRMLDQHKKLNNGVIDMTIVKPYVTEMVADFYDQELISAEEVDKLKKRFEDIENNTSLSEQQKYDQLISLLNLTLDEVQKTPMQCMASTQSCNQRSCCPGLVCAPEPVRKRGHLKRRKLDPREGNTLAFAAKVRCKKDADCESNKCLLPDEEEFAQLSDDEEFALAGMSGDVELDKRTKEKHKRKLQKRKKRLNLGHGRCEPVKRCYAPVAVGGNCFDNPVCAAGKCLKVNLNTNFMGECRAAKKSCENNSQCCSGSCKNNKCVDQFMCKQCVQNGGKAKRGLKCCEGLIPNSKGRCIPDAPPMLFIQNKTDNSLFLHVLNMIMPTAHASDAVQKADSEASSIIRNNMNDYDLLNHKTTTIQEADDKLGKETFMKQVPYFEITEGSDFKNCKIDFRKDYYIQLRQRDMLRAEISLLGFEFVALGSGVSDYWMRDNKSIHTSFKNVAEKLQKSRREFNEDLAETNRVLTCMCYDSKGYDFLDGAGQSYFAQYCPVEYAAYQELKKKMEEKKIGSDTVVAKSIESGDASSIKYLRMMNMWADKMSELKGKSLVRNVDSLKQTNDATNYMINQAPWDQTVVKDFELYRFTIKNLKSGAMLTGAAAGALLAAGAIAIAGGFATASTLTAWAATGIIAASSLAGAGGFWLLGALRGAWQSKTPTVNDSFVKGRESYKCGKKSQCSDFKRVLKQPYNQVCGIHASSNACVKHFLVATEQAGDFSGTLKTVSTMEANKKDVQAHFNNVIQLSEGSGMYFVIDPWVPVGMEKSQLMAGQPVYTDLLEAGFKSALSYLKGGRPGGKQSSGYLSRNVIGAQATAHYAPKLGTQDRYKLTSSKKELIMAAARKYAVDEQFFSESQGEFLDKFAEYAYKYHFLYPKAVPVTEGNISYPPPGLSTYASLIQFGLGRITKVNEEEYRNLLDLQADYRNLLVDRLQIYRDTNELGEEELTAVNSEISRLQGELTDLAEFKGLTTSLTTPNVNTNALETGTNSIDSLLGSGGITSGSDTKGVVRALNTIGTLREQAKEEQEAYNKRMVGNTDRKNALADAQKDLVDSFYNPLGTAKNSFFADSKITDGEQGTTVSGAGKIAKISPSTPFGTKKSYGGNNNTSYGLGLNNGSTDAPSSSLDGGSGLDIGGGSFTADGESQGQISAAIKARNSQPRNKYQPNERDSLFDIVTKAYIRNYDKVLNKKVKKE